MMTIRTVEERLMARPDHGFQLLSSGEEAVAVGLSSALREGDQLLASGRSIGAALARGVALPAVVAELLGRTTGINRGRAGRGHMASPSDGFFGAHAVVGGNITIAAGVALALQQADTDAIAICLFGDGACGQGALFEAINFAALWRLPLLFVCNNNGLAVSTPPERAVAVNSLSDLAAPFGMPRASIDGMDVAGVARAVADIAARVRGGGGPAFLECRSHRFASHSSATRDTRSRAELETAKALCPIDRLGTQLVADNAASPERLAELAHEVAAAVDAAFAAADAAPWPDPAEAFADV